MIQLQVLGQPGRDNAVYLVVDSGQSITRLLFDCGQGCLDPLPVSDVMALDAAFFSHFHMDHISGFDALFRCNYNRPEGQPPLRLIGPIETRRILQNRMQSYTWNLVDNASGSVIVSEFGDGRLATFEFPTKHGFQKLVREESTDYSGTVYSTPDLTVSAIELDHGCISAGYLVREADRVNIDTTRLASLGLKPGPWLKLLKTPGRDDVDETVNIEGKPYQSGELRRLLLQTTHGGSFAYLTDFRPSADKYEALVEFIHGVDVLVCENSYANTDLKLAVQNRHLCSQEVGQLAAAANVGQLVLFHLSDRYMTDGWRQQLEEVRTVFPRADWPTEWKVMLA